MSAIRLKKVSCWQLFSEDALRADLAASDAAVVEADANFAKADTDAQRADKLERNGALSQQAIQVYRTQKQAAHDWIRYARNVMHRRCVCVKHVLSHLTQVSFPLDP